MKTTKQKIFQIICEELNVTKEELNDGKASFRDIDADSLDEISVIVEVEREFGIIINDDDAANFKCIQDLVDYVVSKTPFRDVI